MATDIVEIEWSNEKSLQLIEEYKKNPVLWNSRHFDYHNKKKKQDAWLSIANTLGSSYMDVKKKMDSLLGSFRREKARVNRDLDDVYVSRWFAFKKMRFLLDRGAQRSSTQKKGSVLPNTSGDTQFDYLSDMGNTTGDRSPLSNFTDNLKQGVQIEKSNMKSSHPKSKSSLLSKSHSTRKKKEKEKERRKAKKRKYEPSISIDNSNSKLKEAFKILEDVVSMASRPPDECLLFGQYVENKLRQYSRKTRAIAEHRINDILFQADLGDFDTACLNSNLSSQTQQVNVSPSTNKNVQNVMENFKTLEENNVEILQINKKSNV